MTKKQNGQKLFPKKRPYGLSRFAALALLQWLWWLVREFDARSTVAQLVPEVAVRWSAGAAVGTEGVLGEVADFSAEVLSATGRRVLFGDGLREFSPEGVQEGLGSGYGQELSGNHLETSRGTYTVGTRPLLRDTGPCRQVWK